MPPMKTEKNASVDVPFDALLQRPLQPEKRQKPEAVPAGTSGLSGVTVGWIDTIEEQCIRVRVPLLSETPVPARTTCPLPENCTGCECALMFVDGDPTQPLIIGLMLPSPLYETRIHREKQEEYLIRSDSKRIVVKAEHELELRCGESVILLQRDGRIEIRGNYITSHATATQRIRGGSVHVN